MSDSDYVPDGFRLIPGYPRYAIDEHGTIISVCGRGPGNIRSWKDSKHLKPATGNYGYYQVRLRHDGHSKTIAVHILVLTAFSGQCPSGMECRHLDGNRTNNHVSNLAWGTRSENSQDKLLHGTDSRGERSGLAKLTTVDVLEIRSRAANGERYVDIAKDFLVHASIISLIVRRKRWKHV